MIIHHKEDFSNFHISLFKPLKYSENFTFYPLILLEHSTNTPLKCIFQSPSLFTPFGIQTTRNDKLIIDLSFQNKENDQYVMNFLNKLQFIYNCISHNFNHKYTVNSFLKHTDYNECLRLKVDQNIQIYNENKQSLKTIPNFTYGYFIIHLQGLWLNDNNIWFQWDLLQAKLIIPVCLKDYSFLEENIQSSSSSKYDKMLKMGVPKEAVDKQKQLDNLSIPIPPPPPPPLLNKGNDKKNISFDIPKINAKELQSVQLKKCKPMQHSKFKPTQNTNYFEPPSIEELQTTLSKLKSIK